MDNHLCVTGYIKHLPELNWGYAVAHIEHIDARCSIIILCKNLKQT